MHVAVSNGIRRYLYQLIISGNLKAVQLLLENGADYKMKEVTGKTPIVLANQMGHTKILELFNAHEVKHFSRNIPESEQNCESPVITRQISRSSLTASDPIRKVLH